MPSYSLAGRKGDLSYLLLVRLPGCSDEKAELHEGGIPGPRSHAT